MKLTCIQNSTNQNAQTAVSEFSVSSFPFYEKETRNK